MIAVTLLCAFLAAASLAFGLYILGSSKGEGTLRRRLMGEAGPENLPDVLDPTILREERMSSIGLMNRLLNRRHFAHRIDHLLAQAGAPTSVSVFLLLSLTLGGAAGLAALIFIRHAGVAALATVCAGIVPLLVILNKRDRRVRAFDEQFPDALDLMVNGLRAGLALNGAIQMAAEESPDPVGGEFRILFEEMKLGIDIKSAMINLAERMDSTDVGYFVTAVIIQRDTGGNLAEVLEKIAYVIRERFRILGEVRTFTAQGRLSGLILAVLPIVMAVVLSLLSPGYLKALTDDYLGRMMLSIAVGLQVVGFLTIRRIVNFRI